jgi:hypothetical protein
MQIQHSKLQKIENIRVFPHNERWITFTHEFYFFVNFFTS